VQHAPPQRAECSRYRMDHVGQRWPAFPRHPHPLSEGQGGWIPVSCSRYRTIGGSRTSRSTPGQVTQDRQGGQSSRNRRAPITKGRVVVPVASSTNLFGLQSREHVGMGTNHVRRTNTRRGGTRGARTRIEDREEVITGGRARRAGGVEVPAAGTRGLATGLDRYGASHVKGGPPVGRE